MTTTDHEDDKEEEEEDEEEPPRDTPSSPLLVSPHPCLSRRSGGRRSSRACERTTFHGDHRSMSTTTYPTLFVSTNPSARSGRQTSRPSSSPCVGDMIQPCSVPRGLAEQICGGTWSLLASFPVRSAAQAAEACAPFQPPSKKMFELASRQRVAEVGYVFRDRKRHRGQASDEQVRSNILWCRASAHLRCCDNLREAASDMFDALVNDWSVDDDDQGGSAPPPAKKNKVLRDRVKVDALSCLLQRREVRTEGRATTRSIRIDASPKLGAEILAIEMETIPDGVVDHVRVEKLPGSTLVHGASRVAHKTCLFLWGLFLTHASTPAQMIGVLRTFRCIVNDQGVEACLCDVHNCLACFWH